MPRTALPVHSVRVAEKTTGKTRVTDATVEVVVTGAMIEEDETGATTEDVMAEDATTEAGPTHHRPPRCMATTFA